MYKYTEKFVADLLFNENRIRIGTLNGFRDMEKRQGISDPLEGSYEDHVVIHGTDTDYRENHLFRENLKGFINIDSNANVQNIKFINCSSQTKRVSPNFLIFCSAHTKSFEVMEQFDNADSCFHIHKPETFFQLITFALEKEFEGKVNFLGVHKVNYNSYLRKRSALDSKPIHPALAKTEDFIPQCEVRAIWEIPQHLITKPFYDLQIFGLRRFCRLIQV